jgi:3-oxoacyl-[acyl-carrier-protein] synthase II
MVSGRGWLLVVGRRPSFILARIVMCEVVITGIGIVSPIGVGRDQVWESIVARQSGVRPVDYWEAAGWSAPWGGQVIDFDPKDYIEPRKSIKVMSREMQLASAAAEIAWQDAGLAQATLDPNRLGVVGAAGFMFSEMDELRAPFEAWIAGNDFDINRWSKEAMGALSPLWMLKYLANMATCHIGIRYDSRGSNSTITHGEVSTILALSQAASLIHRDLADVVIVGATGARVTVSDIIWHQGDRLSTNREVAPTEISRPFDLHRTGIVIGEGAAEFILERRDHAERRGARPLARIDGAASRYEPCIESLRPQGDALRRSIRAALAAARVTPGQIGHVNANGNSSLEDDPPEARAIRETLGDVPVTAPKSFFGHLGTGTGAVELAVSLIGLDHGVIPPTINYDTPDPECPVNVVREAERTENRTFMKLNYNATGQAAAVVITAL